ncbi:phosphoribosylamine--glycine ligase [Cadophora sp. DSE1049]|nr:phosphoribosylamine--glycine ligase [Cadophora sp. DSE1049]
MTKTVLKLKVLLIGRGAREHALALKLCKSKHVSMIVVVPGNGGSHTGIPKTCNIGDIEENEFPRLFKLAQELKIDLVVPGPDAPIVNGIEAVFREAKIWCFAPSKEAGQIEGSKAFSKDFMERHKIPTAAYANFTDISKAKIFIENALSKIHHTKWWIKASGLSAGKGVVIPQTRDETFEALDEMMLGDKFGDAGNEFVIEQFLEGEELSIHTFCDGQTKSMPAAQDHKRAFDGNKGPNTGGMACYSPVRAATPSVMKEIERLIIKPTLDGLREEVMLTKAGPKCLEYNTRFGDPEAQTVLPLLKSDLAEIMFAFISGNLHEINLVMENKFCVTVILVSGWYPEEYRTGHKINFKSLCSDSSASLCIKRDSIMMACC